METRSKKIIKPLPFRSKRRSSRKSLTNNSVTPPNDLDVPYVAPAFLAPAFDSFEDLFDNTISEPISQVSVANETITSIQSAASQALINEKKMNKRDVDFARPEWNKGPWNSGLTNAVLFDQVLHENVATNLLVCKMCPLIVEKHHGKTLRIHRAHHFGQENLEPLVQEIRDRALDVIAIDGRPFSIFSTDAMKSYSATCANKYIWIPSARNSQHYEPYAKKSGEIYSICQAQFQNRRKRWSIFEDTSPNSLVLRA
ncbi:hypothetical protein Ddc_12300 [Ditylenchus destructor]|nr:hypothetical protein Ddc_12300 [Ditylenchus destructor]